MDARAPAGAALSHSKHCRLVRLHGMERNGGDRLIPRYLFSVALPLEHGPKKLLDFFDSDMLEIFGFERFLFDRVISRDWEALYRGSG
jgi:hypothetical protein